MVIIALAPCVARSTTVIILPIKDVCLKEGFQRPETVLKNKIEWKYISVVSKKMTNTTIVDLLFTGNVAYNKTAYQGPRTYRIYNASLAVDGNHNPHFVNGSCAHPQGQSWQLPWWQVDLGAIYVISSINITNRFNLRQQSKFMQILLYGVIGW